MPEAPCAPWVRLSLPLTLPHPHPQELLLEFESEVQKREHGFRLHADSMSSTVLTHELKVTAASARASSGEATSEQSRATRGPLPLLGAPHGQGL